MSDTRWATEFRKEDGAGNNTVGVIVAFDGTEFEYNIAGLGEYAIEKNREVALAAAVAYTNDRRPLAQHDFANETSTHAS